jgi:hypothetical protein
MEDTSRSSSFNRPASSYGVLSVMVAVVRLNVDEKGEPALRAPVHSLHPTALFLLIECSLSTKIDTIMEHPGVKAKKVLG